MKTLLLIPVLYFLAWPSSGWSAQKKFSAWTRGDVIGDLPIAASIEIELTGPSAKVKSRYLLEPTKTANISAAQAKEWIAHLSLIFNDAKAFEKIPLAAHCHGTIATGITESGKSKATSLCANEESRYLSAKRMDEALRNIYLELK